MSVAMLMAAIIFIPVLASAATPANPDGFNILTSPLPIKLTTDPGRTVTADLRMKNLGTKPETIKVGLMKFGATGELGQPNIADITAKDEYGKWVSFSPSQFVAQPNVWNTVKMTINVPSDAALGYYMAVTFSRASQINVKAANFKGAVATLVLLDVKSGNAQRKLELVDFSVDHGVYEYLPVNFNIRVKNSGNIHLSPVGNIYIEHRGKPVTNVTFNEAGGSVLPKSNRQFKVRWTSGFPVYKDKLVNGKPVPGKNAEPQQELKWNLGDASKFRFGKYTAKLLVVYDNGKQDVPVESVVSFWVLPWKLMLIALLILLLVVFGLWSSGRSLLGSAKRGASKVRKHGKK